MGLTSGKTIDGVQGTGASYERLMENLGIFDILETL